MPLSSFPLTCLETAKYMFNCSVYHFPFKSWTTVTELKIQSMLIDWIKAN